MKSLVILLVVAFLWISLCKASKESDPNWGKKCRVLALEGGGDKGSYEAGALNAFVELLPPEEINYDVVTGVSVGAINAMALALHKRGDEKKCIDWINKLWFNMTSSNIYSSWPFGIPEGLVFQQGIFNNANEIEFLTNLLNGEEFPEKKLYRKIEFNAVDFDSAEVIRFNEKEDFNSLPKKIVASTSMPFAFPHMHFDDHCYVDGGTVWNVDFAAGINRCREDGFADKNIIVDVILCTGKQVAQVKDVQSFNTMQNYMRYRNIKSYYNSMSDLDELMKHGYTKINFRHLIIPKEPLPSGYIPLGFKHDDIVKMIQLGYEEAKEILLKAEKNSFDQVADIVNDLHNTYDPKTTKNFRPMEIKNSY